jgi:hypothetical protein
MCCVRPGVLRREGQTLLLRHRVDGGRLACIAERPTKAISGVSLAGSCSSLLAVVKKRAVCVQAKAALAVSAGAADGP